MGHLWTAAEQSLRETQAAHRGKQGMLVHRETGQADSPDVSASGPPACWRWSDGFGTGSSGPS